MSIHHRILGLPGHDNALFVTIDRGQRQHHLLFDCGEDCLREVPIARIQEIEAVFFSHFHMDHLSGFDHFLRHNWCRPGQPVRIYGPPGAIATLHHRLQGFTWNLAGDAPGEWIVTEVGRDGLRSSRFLAREEFREEHPLDRAPRGPAVHAGPAFQVRACEASHGTPCLAYLVREADSVNVDAVVLRELGIPPGPWLRSVKDRDLPDGTVIHIGPAQHLAGELRARLLRSTRGETLAYLTDLSLDDPADPERLTAFLEGCRTLVCESNYRAAEAELARANHHMTSLDAAGLAARVQPEALILFHLSARYTPEECRDLLDEARSLFPRAAFPVEWEPLLG